MNVGSILEVGLLECSVYIGCHCPPHSSSIDSYMPEYSVTVVTTKQSKVCFIAVWGEGGNMQAHTEYASVWYPEWDIQLC